MSSHRRPASTIVGEPGFAGAAKAKLRAQPAQPDPVALKKNIEVKLQKSFTALGDLNREAMKL